MLLYCLKCRKNTVSEKPKVVKIKNRGIMLLSKCVVWDCRKLKFIKEQVATGLLSFLWIKTPLNLYRMGFPGLFTDGWGGGQKGPPLPKICHKISYNDDTWHRYALPKKDSKNVGIRWCTPWVPVTAFFHQKSTNFAISRNTYID